MPHAGSAGPQNQRPFVFPLRAWLLGDLIPRVKPTRAFTLVELLVVIAIIAIIAALLLPVLSRSKNQGAKATDLNNLHQIMVVLHLYADDNNGVLPWPNWDYGD